MVDVDVQVQMVSGLPAFTLVGLPDKAVAESRERVRAALYAMGLALPPKRITLPIAIGLLAAMDIVPTDLLAAMDIVPTDLLAAMDIVPTDLLAAMDIVPTDLLDGFSALGELALDGSLLPVAGILPAAVDAARRQRRLICPAAQGREAACCAPACVGPDGLARHSAAGRSAAAKLRILF